MSVHSSSLVWEYSQASGNDLLVLLVIADHDGEGGSWPSIATLARKARVSESTARRCVKSLAALGEITIHERRGGTLATPDRVRTNLFEITIKPTPRPVENQPEVIHTPVTPDRGTPVTPDRGTPVTAMTPEPSFESPVEPPTPPAPEVGIPESLTRLWGKEGISDDEQTQLWATLTADPKTIVPTRRGAQPAWYVPVLAALRAKSSRDKGTALAQVRRYAEECEHGEPAGAEPHPVTGLPLCPLCRRQAAS